MILKVIVARQVNEIETTYWVAGAWDEYTIDENPSGFEEELARLFKAHGEGGVRILNVRIPEGALAKPFIVPVIEGEIVK